MRERGESTRAAHANIVTALIFSFSLEILYPSNSLALVIVRPLSFEIMRDKEIHIHFLRK